MAADSTIPASESRASNLLAAYLALIASIFCIAWSAIFVRWTDMPGPASAFYRMLIPALVLLPTFFFKSGSWCETPRMTRHALAIVVVGGLFFALDLALYNTAILRTSAANATLLGNYTPIVVGLLTWLVFGRRPSTAFWLGLLLAVSGSLVIVWGDLARHARLGWGDVMALGAAACFAVYLMATEQVRTTTGTLAFLRWAFISSTIFLFLMNHALGISLAIPARHSWGALLGLGLISQLGGYLALTYALGHLPATITSITLLSQVPITAILAVFLLGEPLAASQILGGALVLAGVGLAHRQRHPEDEANV